MIWNIKKQIENLGVIRTFTSLLRIFGVLCIFLTEVRCVYAQTIKSEDGYCAADFGDSYFAQLIPLETEASEICFTRSSDIETIDNFILIDITIGPQIYYFLPNVLRLSGRQLKTKKFLKDKSLLIMAEPYKRHTLTKLCKELIQNGFQNPKILIGALGIEGIDADFSVVPAEDYIVEVSNFGAVTVATSRQLADELQALGISAIYPEDNVLLVSVLREYVQNYSINGYLPVFVVGRENEESKLKKQLTKDLIGEVYVVSGGIEKIKNSLKISTINAYKRKNIGGITSCAG